MQYMSFPDNPAGPRRPVRAGCSQLHPLSAGGQAGWSDPSSSIRGSLHPYGQVRGRPSGGTGNFTIAFRAEPDKAQAAEKAIFEQLKAIVDKGVSEDELDRAKRQKIAELVYSQQEAETVAEILANDYMSTGDVNFSRNYTANIQKVTSDEIVDVARMYFDFDRMVITRMVPESMPAEKITSTKKSA